MVVIRSKLTFTTEMTPVKPRLCLLRIMRRKFKHFTIYEIRISNDWHAIIKKQISEIL